MAKETYYNETDPIKRVKELQDIIQRNYDDDNWYGYSETRAKITIACQLELISITGKGFSPTYNCPA